MANPRDIARLITEDPNVPANPNEGVKWVLPTEQEMRNEAEKEFVVGENTKIWYEDFGDFERFIAADIDTGDPGDSFETYQELCDYLDQ